MLTSLVHLCYAIMTGFNVAVTETKDGDSGSAPGEKPSDKSGKAESGGHGAGSGASRRGAAHSRGADSGNGDDTASNADTVEDGGGDDDGPPTIGISSRGRIVRSKFNVRKHLASSKKQL
jgi:hypothetical protein